MGVSHHSDDYQDMKDEFISYFRKELNMEYIDALEVWYRLNSIMNDYGATEWT